MKTKNTCTEPTAPTGDSSMVDSLLREGLQTSTIEGKPLPSDLRNQFESRLHYSFADVRVISSGNSARIADRLNARAFTVGQNIWFGDGEFRPHTVSGQRLLAHELVHTIQQGKKGSGLQKDIVIGRQADPAESEADLIAANVLKNRGIPQIQQRSPALRREPRPSCTVSPESSPDQCTVTCGNQRYRVTVVVVSSQEPETQTSADWGINNRQVWLDIEICRGETAVTIRPSVNLPQAFERVLRNVFSRSDVLQGVTVTPELRITIAQSRSFAFSIAGGPIVDVGQGEVTGGRGGLALDTRLGRFELGGEGRRGEGGLPSTFSFTFGVTPGDTRPAARQCTTTRRRLRMRCERLTTIPAVPATEAVSRTLRREVYLLFPYSKSTPIEQILLREGNGTPAESSASSISSLIDQGYRVQSIEGFASPEGPRPASARRRFQGNIQLSQERANAAQRWLIDEIPGAEGQSVTPVGRAELYSPGETPELEGRALTEYVTPRFLESDPMRPETEQGRQTLSESSIQSQRDNIYPQLRRAVIALERTVEVSPARAATPAREESAGVTCPDAVRQAVTRHYRIPEI